MTHFLQRTALIALASGAVGAYSTPSAAQLFKPNFPIRASDAQAASDSTQAEDPAQLQTQAQAQARPAATPAAQPGEAPLTTAPAAPVDSRPLAPLPAPAPAPAAPTPPVSNAPAQRAPTPLHAPPTFRTVTSRSVTGRVIEVEGPAESYKVKHGDTLEKIARKLDTTVEALKADNRLRRSTVHPGQVLKGPRIAAKAYVAGSGDTLYSIARRFGVSPEALRSENGVSSRASIRPGQKIRLPQDYRDHGPLTTSIRVPAGAAEPEAAREETSEPEAPARAQRSMPSAPAYRTVTSRSVTGRVVEVEGPPQPYRVKRGDTLEKIARKLDTTVSALKEDNHLRHNSVRPGQTLKGPSLVSKAYVAGAEDTLSEIARRFGVSPEALRATNGLSRRASIHAGEKIRLPDDYHDHGPLTSSTRIEVPAGPPREENVPAPAYRAPAPRPYVPPPSLPSSPRPYAAPVQSRPYVPPPYPTPGVTSAPSASDAQISELGRGRFIWPLAGSIVSDYGPKAAGQRNDGINIGAQVGAPVRAAAGGDVVYAGDQVPGFGNLVLIKHPDGWVTAYGHLSRVEVKMQQHVNQGEEIGLAGATGGVSEPQLHFEIRYAPNAMERARPVDPKLVLPRQ